MQLLKSVLAKNFASLGTLQLVNFLLPLLLTPYLIRVLGVNNFGTISLAQAVISYFTIITDYGFNLTATKAIAIDRQDKHKIAEVFNQVISVKLMLSALCFVLLLMILYLADASEAVIYLYLLTYTIVVGQALLPLWFFQGMEDMKYITILSLLTKVVSVILIVLFVRNQEHYILVNFFHGVGTLLAGVASFFLIRKKFNVTFRFSHKTTAQLKEGWHIFVSNLTINIYTNSNIIILGLFANKEIVGYYSIAEKVINAARQLLVVYFQVIYPHVCNLAANTQGMIFNFFKRVFVPFAGLMAVVSLGIFFLSDYIVLFFVGSYNDSIAFILSVLSFIPLIVALNIPPHQIILAFDHKKYYSAIFIAGASINIILNLVLSYYFQAVGTAFAVLFTELLITVGLYWAAFWREGTVAMPRFANRAAN